MERLREHGVKDWRDDGHTALGIKVGIIDWSFRGLNDTPDLVDLDIWDEDDNPDGNAYCQPVKWGVWPMGRVLDWFSPDCEPIVTDHGVNIAELVRDMAPSAELFYAQANSPRQVYKAARWLDETKNVDVIVHAAGWAYDGPGDGTSPLGADDDWIFNESDPAWNTNVHSPYLYKPSPLNTVDKFTEDGPVWINAAGNMEQLTMRKTGLSVVGGTSVYKDFLVLNDSRTGTTESDAADRTCQNVPWQEWSIYIHNLRWSDTWASPKVDMDFFLVPGAVHPSTYGYQSHGNTAPLFNEQLSRNYPVRRTVHLAGDDLTNVCLRIRVNRDDEGDLPTLPNWIQFQIITQDYETAASWNTGNDVTGHSIVNPASSASPNLLAVGARDMRSSSAELMPYSSQGPVYRKGASLTSEAPGRIKPDVTAASGAATWTKFNNECDDDDTAAECGEDLYFGGTSAATGQTGGMAALVVQLFKEIGIPYSAADVASYLKDAGVQIKAGKADENYEWGHGFIKLPCRSIPVTAIPYTSSSARWNTEDCKSTRRSGAYVDYYTFHSTVDRKIRIDVESSVDSYLYLIEGAYNGGDGYLERDDNGGDDADDAHITRDITAGTYTIAVTTRSSNRTGSYTLMLRNAPTWDSTLTPVPGTMVSDGSWNRFKVSSGGNVKVVVNPSGTPRLEIGTSKTLANQCPNQTNEDFAARSDGQYIYISGCVPGTGTIELRRVEDDSLVRTYTVTVSAPTWDAILDPGPGTVTFTDDGSMWHKFEVDSGGDVKVVVNPTSPARLEISTSSSSGNLCGGEVNDTKNRSDGDSIYLAGCAAGAGAIELRREVDDSLVRTYDVAVVAAASQACNPLRSFDTDRRSATSVYISWSNPLSGGAASTGRTIEIKKWVNNAWADERTIYEPATGTSAWHLGIDGNSWYAYRAKNVCGGKESRYTSWSTERPWSDSSSGSRDSTPTQPPTPTPTPDGASGTSDSSNDEVPPPPEE